MTQEEFNEKKEKYAKECAEVCCISFQEYDWDKLIQHLDYSTHFGSRNKYELYKNNQIITPYLDETGNQKLYQGKHNIMLFQSEKWNNKNDFPVFYQECQYDISTRWNIWEFTLYSSGEHESDFVWNEAANLENLMLCVQQNIDYWGNEFLSNDISELYPDWQKAVVKTYIKDNKVVVELIYLNEKAIFVPFEMPENMQSNYIGWQDYCNNDKLKSLFATPWNGIIFNLNASKWFTPYQDTEFIFEENA